MDADIQTEKRSGVFNTMADKFKNLGWPQHVFTGDEDFAIFQPQKVGHALPWGTPRMLLNYFVFSFTKNARGHYVIDDLTFPFEPCTFFFTNPGHYRSVWFDELEESWTIAISERFLKEYTHVKVYEEFPFLLGETYPGAVLSHEACVDVEALYKQIHREYTSESPYRNRVIGNLFVVLLLKIKEHFRFGDGAVDNIGRTADIVNNFKRLLEKHYRDLSLGTVQVAWRVQNYATVLNIHPVYLSNLLKLKTGKSAATWIVEKNITEAKSLLQNSTLSVSEICYQLGFAKPSHFNSYFKKHTGMSPGSYRKRKGKSKE